MRARFLPVLALLCAVLPAVPAKEPYFSLAPLPEERRSSAVLEGRWTFYEREEKAVMECTRDGLMLFSLQTQDKRVTYTGSYTCGGGSLVFHARSRTEQKDSLAEGEAVSEEWHITYALLEHGELTVTSSDIPPYIRHDFSRPTSFR